MRFFRRPWTLLVITGAAVCLIARAVWPAVPVKLPACAVREVTGLHCPGCGGTRCVTRLLQGDWSGAWSGNPLIVTLLGLGIAWSGMGMVREWSGRSMPVFPGWAAWTLVAAVLLFAVLRNLPWWPFTLLAPA